VPAPGNIIEFERAILAPVVGTVVVLELGPIAPVDTDVVMADLLLIWLTPRSTGGGPIAPGPGTILERGPDDPRTVFVVVVVDGGGAPRLEVESTVLSREPAAPSRDAETEEVVVTRGPEDDGAMLVLELDDDGATLRRDDEEDDPMLVRDDVIGGFLSTGAVVRSMLLVPVTIIERGRSDGMILLAGLLVGVALVTNGPVPPPEILAAADDVAGGAAEEATFFAVTVDTVPVEGGRGAGGTLNGEVVDLGAGAEGVT